MRRQCLAQLVLATRELARRENDSEKPRRDTDVGAALGALSLTEMVQAVESARVAVQLNLKARTQLR